jgi:hypothetical protein
MCACCGPCAAGQWRRACVCCEALMRGCNDRAALSSSEAYAPSRGAEAPAAPSTAGDTLLTSLGVTAPLATPGQLAAASAAAGSSATEPEPPVQKQQQQMWGIMGFGGLFIDNYQLAPDATDTQVGRGQSVGDEPQLALCLCPHREMQAMSGWQLVCSTCFHQAGHAA